MRLFVIYFVLVSCCFAEGYGRYPSEWLGDPLGNAQYNSIGVGCAPSGVSGEAKIGTILPCDDSSANVMRLPSGSSASDVLSIQDDTGSEVARFTSTGVLFTDSSISSSGNVIGNAAEFQVYNASNASSDWRARLKSDTKSFLLQDSSANDTFTFSLSGDDRVMSFIGGTNTGTLTWDDSANRLSTSSLQATGDLLSNRSLATVGYFGGTSSDPAAFPKGLEIGPVASTPTAPTTGVILFSDSEDYSNLKVVFPSGNVVTVATDPSP